MSPRSCLNSSGFLRYCRVGERDMWTKGLICAGEEMLMRTTPQILNATKNLFAVMSVDVLGTMPPKDISM